MLVSFHFELSCYRRLLTGGIRCKKRRRLNTDSVVILSSLHRKVKGSEDSSWNNIGLVSLWFVDMLSFNGMLLQYSSTNSKQDVLKQSAANMELFYLGGRGSAFFRNLTSGKVLIMSERACEQECVQSKPLQHNQETGTEVLSSC